jgi:hypothetical protein
MEPVPRDVVIFTLFAGDLAASPCGSFSYRVP